LEENSGSRVADYYGSVENRLWDRLTDGHIHLGYWDEENGDADFAKGTLRLTLEMIATTAVGTGQRFVDIGCGLGVPAMLLAQTRGCAVNGVTISPYQCREAQMRAARAGLSGQVHFQVADALALPYADATFDGGWLFESIFHMGHRPALREARRVLKPGAELLLADVVDIGILSEQDKRFASELCNAHYIPTSDYPALLAETGFELLRLRDVTSQVMAPLDTKLRSAVAAQRESLLAMTDTATLDGFAGVAGQLARSAGYALIRAKRI